MDFGSSDPEVGGCLEMSPWLSRLVIPFLLIVVAACVDTADPTGPVPQPEPPENPGDFTQATQAAEVGPSSGVPRPGSRALELSGAEQG